MPGDYASTVRSLSPAKALAIGAYGESVAAYRYRKLCEKATNPTHRAVFEEMAAEEQDHHAQLQGWIAEYYPGSDFVLSPEDKALVIVGPRMADVTDQASFDRVLSMIADSERLTGKFYATLHEATSHPQLKPLLKEMANECFEHADRLAHIPPLE